MSNFRSPALLALARLAPRCFCCQRPNDGTVVAAHSNAQRHGKGIGLKAHDLPAYVCIACHDEIDGRSGSYGRPMREALWADAMFGSMLWLLQDGHLQFTPNPRPAHLAPIEGRR